MFVVRFFTKFDKTLPHCQKSSAQVLQSAPGELGSGATNRSVNPDLICPPYILWPGRVCSGSDPSSRDLSRRRVISASVARFPPSSHEQHPSSPNPVPVVGRCVPVVAHVHPSSLNPVPVVGRCVSVVARAHPSSPDPVPVVRRCVPVVARFFF